MDLYTASIIIGPPALGMAAAWTAWSTSSPAKAALGTWVSTSILALFLVLMMSAGRIRGSMMTHTNEQFPISPLERIGQLTLLALTLLLSAWVYRHKSRLKQSGSAEEAAG